MTTSGSIDQSAMIKSWSNSDCILIHSECSWEVVGEPEGNPHGHGENT